MAQFDEGAVRQRLEADRARLEEDIRERTVGDEAVVATDPLSDSGGMPSEQGDDADALMDAERNQAVLRNSQELLDEVNAALDRLDAGTYGICQRCGREIPARRLEVLPYVAYDVECQAIVEREQGQTLGRSIEY